MKLGIAIIKAGTDGLAAAALLARDGHDVRNLPVDDAYAAMRRWHVRFYQGMSALFIPMYQSRIYMLSDLRNHIPAPMSRVPGIRHAVPRLITGTLASPLAGEALSALLPTGILSRKSP